MPGLTNNTTLLAAENQLILTQNEQSVKLDEIEAAILSLKGAITTGGGSGVGGEGGGSGPSGIQDLVGLDPEEDFTTEQQNSRCTKANFIVDALMEIIDGFIDDPLEEGIEMSGIVLGGIAGWYIGPLLAGLVGLSVPATAAILGLIGYALTKTLNFENIYDALEDNKQPIINDLYTSKNLFEARNAITDNAGLDAVNNQALGLIVFNDLLAILFQDAWEPPADYTPLNPCDSAQGYIRSCVYTGPTQPPVDPISYGYQDGGAVGSCEAPARYTVSGESNCQITLPIDGILTGKTTVTLNYALYYSLGTATVELSDGAESVSSFVGGCDNELILVTTGLSSPQITITSTSANGADFWPWLITLS